MATDNTKLGYCYSVALHLVIAFGLCAYAFINALFPKEEKENKVVFDMVEPSPEQIADIPPPPAPDAAAPEIKTEKIEKIDPVEIPEPTPPEPEPEPEPTPPEPTPAPTPEPAPVPKPKPPKQEKPKKISFADFKKTNPKKATNTKKRPTQKVAPVKVGTIRPSTSNLDNISSISQSKYSSANMSAAASAAMADALQAYKAQIYMLAKRNWKIPTISTDGLEAKVAFKVSRLGIISGVRIVESSGDSDFDKSVVEVFRSITIPPPPDNEPHSVTILFKAQ